MGSKLNSILFLVDMNEEQKTGLFNATYQRIKGLSEYIENFEIYSIKYYDGKLFSLMKKMRKKRVTVKGDSYFYYKELKINYVYIKRTIFTQLLKKLKFYLPILTVLKLKKKVLKHNIICAHWGYPQGTIAKMLSKKLNVPYTVTYHGSDIHSLPNSDGNFKKNIIKSINESDLNIFVSKSLLELSIEKLNNRNENNIVITNTIDTDSHYELSSEEVKKVREKLKLKGKVVGFVGNLVHVKRSDRLPEIFNFIKLNYNKEVSFLVIGDGEYSSLIKDKCKEYKIDCVFLGNVDPNEINNYMNLMDILILPSRNEAFGLVILEANACGTLVIGSNVGGVAEAIGDNDLLVNESEDFERDIGRKVVFYLETGYDKRKLKERIELFYSPKVLHNEEYNSLCETLERYRKNNKR